MKVQLAGYFTYYNINPRTLFKLAHKHNILYNWKSFKMYIPCLLLVVTFLYNYSGNIHFGYL